MLFRFILLAAFPLAALGQTSGSKYKCPDQCTPPACMCASTSIPGGLQLRDTPQFVTLTFDDAIQYETESFITPILNRYKNPNGCPLPATFFTQVLNSNWSSVQRTFNLGNEIASLTMTHKDLTLISDPSAEIKGSRETIHAFGGVPKTELRGFRAPFLSYGDTVFQVLQKNGFLYDSSVKLSPIDEPYWPHTLDYGFPYALNSECASCSSPTSMLYPGLWEIPLYTLLTDQGKWFADMDPPHATSDDQFLKYLIYSFDLHYKKKLPFGLYQHIAQYTAYGDEFQARRVKVLEQFIQYVQSKYSDVWFVTNLKLLDWIVNPIPNAQMVAKTPCILPPQDVNNPEICDGIDNNLNGIVDEGCVQACMADDETYFSSCYGCPLSAPSPSNPVPKTFSVRAHIPAAGCPNLQTWDPVEGLCVTLKRPSVAKMSSDMAADKKVLNSGYSIRKPGIIIVSMLFGLIFVQ